MNCPNCGYCEKCGRANAPNTPIPFPFPLLGGYRCACGAWVYPQQVHTCPVYTNPMWITSSTVIL